eukprot:GHVT01030340.1.p1 GENE.GHVT01030340.1~~GHVT01030340.1.p1  ORF type:complete len:365 (+),score=79.21 GHVT01030340.1:426-1520(+)
MPTWLAARRSNSHRRTNLTKMGTKMNKNQQKEKNCFQGEDHSPTARSSSSSFVSSSSSLSSSSSSCSPPASAVAGPSLCDGSSPSPASSSVSWGRRGSLLAASLGTRLTAAMGQASSASSASRSPPSSAYPPGSSVPLSIYSRSTGFRLQRELLESSSNYFRAALSRCEASDPPGTFGESTYSSMNAATLLLSLPAPRPTPRHPVKSSGDAYSNASAALPAEGSASAFPAAPFPAAPRLLRPATGDAHAHTQVEQEALAAVSQSNGKSTSELGAPSEQQPKRPGAAYEICIQSKSSSLTLESFVKIVYTLLRKRHGPPFAPEGPQITFTEKELSPLQLDEADQTTLLEMLNACALLELVDKYSN